MNIDRLNVKIKEAHGGEGSDKQEVITYTSLVRGPVGVLFARLPEFLLSILDTSLYLREVVLMAEMRNRSVSNSIKLKGAYTKLQDLILF
jgi:hypothetical protein